MKKIQKMVLLFTFTLANTLLVSAETTNPTSTTVSSSNPISNPIINPISSLTSKQDNTYKLHAVPHTGPKNITLDLRFGIGTATVLFGLVNSTSLSNALSNIYNKQTFAFDAGASFVLKKLMIDVNYHSAPAVTLLNTATTTSVEGTVGFTWNRKPGNLGYGYVFAGLTSWGVASRPASIVTSVAAPSLIIGLRGLSATKLGNSNMSFLYYGSFYFGGGVIVDSTTYDVSPNSTPASSRDSLGDYLGASFFVGAEQGIGFSFDSIGITTLIKGRGEFGFAISSGGSKSLYAISAPFHLTLNVGKYFYF